MPQSKEEKGRTYDLSSADVSELQAEFAKTKRFPNPHQVGAYKYTLDAIVGIGVNKPIPIAKVYDAFKKAAGAQWFQAWANKKPRNKETGKDARERFLQNLKVLQRTSDFGRKVLLVGKKVMKSKGAVIDLMHDDKGGLLVKLNTNSATPLKAGRMVKPDDKPQKAAKAKPKTASKVSKARVRKVVKTAASTTAPEASPKDDAPQN